MKMIQFVSKACHSEAFGIVCWHDFDLVLEIAEIQSLIIWLYPQVADILEINISICQYNMII